MKCKKESIRPALSKNGRQVEQIYGRHNIDYIQIDLLEAM